MYIFVRSIGGINSVMDNEISVGRAMRRIGAEGDIWIDGANEVGAAFSGQLESGRLMSAS